MVRVTENRTNRRPDPRTKVDPEKFYVPKRGRTTFRDLKTRSNQQYSFVT